MNTYTIEPDGSGGFQVKVTGSGPDNGKITTGFATVVKAQEWVNDRLRHEHGIAHPQRSS